MRLQYNLVRYLPDSVAALAVFLWARPEVPLMATYGYARSLKLRQPLDENGEALPWLPYCVTTLLKTRLQRDFRVLEFGSGYSTLFFMSRVATIASIEHDQRWLEHLRGQCATNVMLVPASADSAEQYCSFLTDHSQAYDLILVDGIYRVESFSHAIDVLSSRGIIVLDDSDRPEYQGAFALAAAAQFRSLTLQGHKPGSVGLNCTTIFYRDGNCLGI